MQRAGQICIYESASPAFLSLRYANYIISIVGLGRGRLTDLVKALEYPKIPMLIDILGVRRTRQCAGPGNVSIAGSADACDQEAHRNPQEQRQRNGPRVSRVAEGAEEEWPDSG